MTVEVKRPAAHSWDWFGLGSARRVVSAPEAANVRASSGDGAIRVARVNGTIALRSGDGRIQASNSSGSVSASTGDGGIDLDGVDGAVEAIHGDGRVRVSGKLTAVRARRATAASPSRRGQAARPRPTGTSRAATARSPFSSPTTSTPNSTHTRGTAASTSGRQRHDHGHCHAEQRPRPAGLGRPSRARVYRRRLDHAAASSVRRSSAGFHARSFVNRSLAYLVGSSMPASTNALCRSRHLLHVPQCRGSGCPAMPIAGLMHDSVSSNGHARAPRPAG